MFRLVFELSISSIKSIVVPVMQTFPKIKFTQSFVGACEGVDVGEGVGMLVGLRVVGIFVGSVDGDFDGGRVLMQAIGSLLYVEYVNLSLV
jgi:hypothetical protein